MQVTEPPTVELSKPPAMRLGALTALAGATVVAEWCARLLSGVAPYDDPQWPSIGWLGGAHATSLLRRRGKDLGDQAYWPRVWAARGLLHIWSQAAAAAVVTGLCDEAWRVREMAAKVAGKRELGDAVDELVHLTDDPVPRVRLAAIRALGRIGDVDALDALDRLSQDRDLTVRIVSGEVSKRLRERLNRE